jgi:hypothetical protein
MTGTKPEKAARRAGGRTPQGRSAGERALKKSVTIPASVAAEVATRVGPREFSAYVTKAVVRQLEHDRLAELVDELTDTFGEVPEDVAAEVDRQWRDALK